MRYVRPQMREKGDKASVSRVGKVFGQSDGEMMFGLIKEK